jgi:hypothetical protein
VDWYWWVLIGLIVVGGFAKGSEQNKKAEEDQLRKQRAEEAREKILASGNEELISRLHLMEATGAGRQVANTQGGGNALGTAAAVAGGVLVANAVSAQIAAAELEAAFADIQADVDGQLAELDASIDDLDLDIDV